MVGLAIGRIADIATGMFSRKSPLEEDMAKYPIQTKRGVPPGGAYSQGWRAGDFLFVSGTGPIDPGTGKLVGQH